VDEAYDYVTYLRREYPRLAGLKEMQEAYLMADAKATFSQGRAELALGTLIELQRLNSQFPGLENAYGAVTDRLVETYVKQGDLETARGLLATLVKKFPKHPIERQWHERFETDARELLSKARADMAAENFAAAHDKLRVALAYQPTIAGGAELRKQITERYPI